MGFHFGFLLPKIALGGGSVFTCSPSSLQAQIGIFSVYRPFRSFCGAAGITQLNYNYLIFYHNFRLSVLYGAFPDPYNSIGLLCYMFPLNILRKDTLLSVLPLCFSLSKLDYF